MLNAALGYKKDKEDCFKYKITARKKELGYLTPKKATLLKVKCFQCVYMEAFTPYSQRCSLISYSDRRIASVSLEGGCKLATKDNFESELLTKYPFIEYENITISDIREYNSSSSKNLR